MHTHKYLSAITQKNGVEIDINKYFRRLFLWVKNKCSTTISAYNITRLIWQ
jgi:hypothetical protein